MVIRRLIVRIQVYKAQKITDLIILTLQTFLYFLASFSKQLDHFCQKFLKIIYLNQAKFGVAKSEARNERKGRRMWQKVRVTACLHCTLPTLLSLLCTCRSTINTYSTDVFITCVCCCKLFYLPDVVNQAFKTMKLKKIPIYLS